MSEYACGREVSVEHGNGRTVSLVTRANTQRCP